MISEIMSEILNDLGNDLGNYLLGSLFSYFVGVHHSIQSRPTLNRGRGKLTIIMHICKFSN